MIKGNKSGIVLVLDKEIDFLTLKKDIADKFKESSKFLGVASMAISFEGRKLSTEEQRQVLDIIEKNSDLKILCIVDSNPAQEKMFQKSMNEKLMELNTNSGQFYKGNLRSGQVLEVETSIIIIGDVNIGAKVVSKGNIIVLGALKGNAFAGATGNEKAFVVALSMQPIQIRIADSIARAPDREELRFSKEKRERFLRRDKKMKSLPPQETKIAFVEDGNIYIEPLNKDVLSDINL